jgi:TonB family protein
MKYIFTLFTLQYSIFCFSQINTSDSKVDSIYKVAEKMPMFPGGELEMFKFIKANLKYPESEKLAKISGKCYIGFVVEKDGSISDVRVLKGVTGGPGCDEEAKRVVLMMPEWIPGEQNGEKVRVSFNLPVKFTLKIVPQENDTLYFNLLDQLCTKEESEYYRLVYNREKGYLVKEWSSKNDMLKMVAECSQFDPLIIEGKATYYSDNGEKNSEGKVVNKKRVGKWIFWGPEIKDSLVISIFADGTYKNIYVPEGHLDNNEYDVAYKYEIMPVFPGGEMEMMKFIMNHVRYPDAEMNRGISGTCYVTFVVEKDGSITDVRVLRGVKGGLGCDIEAMRVIRQMPKWTPGTQLGKPVRVQFNLPIKFTLK